MGNAEIPTLDTFFLMLIYYTFIFTQQGFIILDFKDLFYYPHFNVHKPKYGTLPKTRFQGLKNSF